MQFFPLDIIYPGPVNMIFLLMKNLFLIIRKVQKQITSVDLFGPKS